MRISRILRRLPYFQNRRINRPSPPSSYQIVQTRVARGYSFAIASNTALRAETLFPFLSRIVSPRHARTRIWLHIDDANRVPSGTLAITARIQKSLHLETPRSAVLLQVPTRSRLRVRTPPALDLPTGAAVHISKAAYRAILTGPHVRRHALLTTGDGVVIPVRLHKRDIDNSTIFVPLSLRTLGGFATGSEVQLTAIPKTPFREKFDAAANRVLSRRARSRFIKVIAIMLGYLLLALRFLDIFSELVLRAAFRSQSLTFRVIQAHPGDDDLQDTIRLHPSAFGALALRPGGQVLLHWGGQRMAVRALEDQKPFDGEFSSHVMRSVGLHLDSTPLSTDFPANLIARIPAPVRCTLNIPPNTVIEMRRKLRPALVSQLNQLAVPVAGLVATAAALPEVRGWPLLLGGILALVFGLAPLRMPRPPRGPWP